MMLEKAGGLERAKEVAEMDDVWKAASEHLRGLMQVKCFGVGMVW